jgi:hypothetical protein
MAENSKQPTGMQTSSERDAVQGGNMQASGSATGSGPDARDIKQQAREMADQTKERGKAMLEQQRGAAAGQVDSVAHAFRTAAEQLQREGQGTGNYVGMVADQLESAARQLREKNLDEIMHGVQDLARRSPATFIAGSVAVGFLLSRFLKSSSQHAYGQNSSRAYGRDDDFGDRGYDRNYDHRSDRAQTADQDFERGGSLSGRPVEEVYGYSPEDGGISPQAQPYSGASTQAATDTSIGTGSNQATIATTPDIKSGTDKLGGNNYGNR